MRDLNGAILHGLNAYRENAWVGGNWPVTDYIWLTYLPWVLPSKQAMYMSVPKNACTSLKILFCGLSGKAIPKNHGDVHRIEYGWHLVGKVSETIGVLTAPNWFRFCFVRNPYDRLLSAYKSKIAPGTHEDCFYRFKQAIQEKYGCAMDAIRFEDFVRYVSETTNKDSHWALQVHLLKPELINYQFVGRMENLADDISKVCKRLDLQEATVPRLNVTKATKLSEVYNQELADMVYETYKPDFVRYGYDQDSWEV